MSDSVFVYPRKLLKRFITLYKELPCLWDRTCVTYKHKHKRHEAISKLTELVQEYDPNATRVHVLRKIESLRACVRREYKRVQDSRRTATNVDEIYTPHLWYYDMFSFVFGDDGTGYNTSEIGQNEDSDGINDNEEDDSMENYALEYNDPSNMLEISQSSPKREENQKRILKRHCTEIADEYDAIGINVAAKLRALPPNVRILAEKLINDVLYQAQMNGLNSSSVISTTDPIKQDCT